MPSQLNRPAAGPVRQPVPTLTTVTGAVPAVQAIKQTPQPGQPLIRARNQVSGTSPQPAWYTFLTAISIIHGLRTPTTILTKVSQRPNPAEPREHLVGISTHVLNASSQWIQANNWLHYDYVSHGKHHGTVSLTASSFYFCSHISIISMYQFSIHAIMTLRRKM